MSLSSRPKEMSLLEPVAVTPLGERNELKCSSSQCSIPAASCSVPQFLSLHSS